VRILHAYFRRRLAKPLQYTDFVEKFTLDRTAIGVKEVLEIIQEFESSDAHIRMMVVHIDETNTLNDNAYLVDMLQTLYRAMRNKTFFLVCMFTGTNASTLRSLKVCFPLQRIASPYSLTINF